MDQLIPVLASALAKRGGLRFAVVFGSAVTRGLERARDIDVALSFARPVSWLDLGGCAVDLEARIGREVDVVDLEDASTLLRWEVLQTGRLVLAPDREAWLSFQARVPLEMDDLRPYLDRESAGLRRALEAR